MRVFASHESIGRLPTIVMIETAANALNAGSKQTGCGRSQYEDIPDRLSESEFRFQPKLAFEKKCPYVTIGIDPYWGDLASVVEERNSNVLQMQPDEGPHGRSQANVTALVDLTVQGGDINGKDVNLIALDDVTLTGEQNKTVYGSGNDTGTHGVENKTTQVGSDVNGATVDISAGNNLTTVDSTIESPGNVNLSAQGKIDYLAALNVKKARCRAKPAVAGLA